MRTSESIGKIAIALLAAQKSITFASKEAVNPHFKNTYANLESVIGAIKEPLNDNEIFFTQTFSPSAPNTLSLTTRLLHSSGEWIEDTMTMPLQKNDAQGYGSAATYSRRYALAAITGLFQADDDGQEAVKPQPTPKLSVDQITAIEDTAKETGVTIEQICAIGKVKKISEVEASRYDGLLNWIKSQNKAA